MRDEIFRVRVNPRLLVEVDRFEDGVLGDAEHLVRQQPIQVRGTMAGNELFEHGGRALRGGLLVHLCLRGIAAVAEEAAHAAAGVSGPPYLFSQCWYRFGALDEGFRLLSNIVCEEKNLLEIECGKRVELIWEEHPEFCIPLFRLL